MTAPDPRLDEIQARVDKTPPDHGHTQSWLPAADVRYLLAELRKAHEALTRVEGVLEEKRGLWAAICGETCVKEIYGVDHEAIADEIAATIRAAVAAANGDGD